MKKSFMVFLPLLFAGCTLLSLNSKHIATFEQKEGWQVVEKNVDIFGTHHEIIFAFHGHRCEKEISGQGYVEVFYADGERIAGAAFNLSDLTFPGTGDRTGLLCDPTGFLRTSIRSPLNSRPLSFALRGGAKTLTFRIGIYGFKSADATYLDIWSASYSMIPYGELEKLRRERMVETTNPSRSR